MAKMFDVYRITREVVTVEAESLEEAQEQVLGNAEIWRDKTKAPMATQQIEVQEIGTIN